MRNSIIALSMIFLSSCIVNQQDSKGLADEELFFFETNKMGTGPYITLEFTRGESFYYPLMAVWLEEIDSTYIQTLYVARSVATSVFRFGETSGRQWIPGVRRYPQTLPYWSHKRGVVASDGLYMPEPDNPVPDAYTGATPTTGFIMLSRSDMPLDRPVRILLEINQNWDWNEYWTNDRYPDDEDYKRSCQPALVYEAILDPAFAGKVMIMRPIGHSHYSGRTGDLYKDLSTLTTALHIADTIKVSLGR